MSQALSAFRQMQQQSQPPQPPVQLGPAISGRKRRSKVLLTTVVTILAATAMLVVVNVVSERYHARLDMTATGSQKLSPRTERVLARLPGPVRIVVATDLKSADVRARERVKDVLSEMQRSSRGLTYTFIDTQSTSGFDSYKRTLRELVTRDQRLIDEQAATVNLGTTAAQALGTYLTNELSPGLQQVQGSISAVGQQADNNRAYFEQTAASARLLAQDLTASIQRANELLGRKLDDLALPASDAAALAIADGLARCVDQMTAISRELRRFVEIPGMAGPPATAAKAVIPTLERQRDQASLLIESLRRLKRLDLTRISEVLQSRNAAGGKASTEAVRRGSAG